MADQSEFDIPALLNEYGPASGPEIATLLDVHPATVERRCATLQQDGRIRMVTGGKYAVVERSRVRTRTASD